MSKDLKSFDVLGQNKPYPLDKQTIQVYNEVTKFALERIPSAEKEKEKHMKKFFAEFKKFITRGNVIDMAVGVIVGSAFTAIVNGLSNNILKPIINWVLAMVFGANSLSEVFTFLKYVPDATDPTKADLTQSIYIDWGAFINAVINFFLIALVLFTIVKLINAARENNAKIAKKMATGKPTKEEKKEMKKQGINRKDEAAVAAYYAEKARIAEEEKKAAEEKAKKEREENPSTEDLLKQIRDLLQKNA